MLGKLVVGGLVESALDFMDPNFTAKMEEDLDKVEAGRLGRVALLDRFYKRFRSQLDRSQKKKRWSPEPAPTDKICAECGSKMLKRWSKNGWFLGCSTYPKCKFTRDLGSNGAAAPAPRETAFRCDKCGRPMVLKTGRFGEFLSCSGYPKCKNTRPVPLGVPCPKCGGDLIEIRSRKKGGRSFYGCSNYNAEQKCDFKLWAKPVAIPCPRCGAAFLTLRAGRKPMYVCMTEDCGYRVEIPEEESSTRASMPPPDAAPPP
jgi:DNA topoisomerase-1